MDASSKDCLTVSRIFNSNFHSIEISQFYKLGLSVSNPNILVAGAQDNGTERLSSSGWDAIRGADGMECIIDPADPNIIYSSSQYGGIKVSYDAGYDVGAQSGDLNLDGINNILDIVSLVNIIVNP